MVAFDTRVKPTTPYSKTGKVRLISSKEGIEYHVHGNCYIPASAETHIIERLVVKNGDLIMERGAHLVCREIEFVSTRKDGTPGRTIGVGTDPARGGNEGMLELIPDPQEFTRRKNQILIGSGKSSIFQSLQLPDNFPEPDGYYDDRLRDREE